MFSRPFTLDRVVRLFLAAAAIFAAIWLIDILKDVLLPFCVACLLAYILEPLVELNQSVLRLKRRGLAIFLTLSEVAFLVALIAYFIVPSITSEISQMSDLINKASKSGGGAAVPFIPKEVHDFIYNNLNAEQLKEMLSGSRLETILNKGTTLISTSVGLVMHTIEWLLTFIYVIFILIDYRKLMRGFRKLVPPKYRKQTYRVFDDIKDSMNRYFRGQALIALCAAVFYCIGFSIVGIPLALVMGVIVGVLYMIPYFQYVTLIPIIAICYITSMDGSVEFWPELGKCILVYVISQCVCDYVLTPKIMGKALGLNPAIILLSLSVWGTLLGLLGMIIALPMTTLILSYYERYILHDDPAAPEASPSPSPPTP
ncbi:MAG: AI-2E family transporter [Clostridium sp.]|nr:AI-2E family transporter [Clostridium sp.]